MKGEDVREGIDLTLRYGKGCGISADPESFKGRKFWPLYEEIAKKNKMGVLNANVVRAYWRSVQWMICAQLTHDYFLITVYLPGELAQGTREEGPSVLMGLNQCLVHPAKVIGVRGKKILTEYHPLLIKNGRLIIGRETLSREVENLTGRNLASGSIVTIHNDVAPEQINAMERTSLVKEMAAAIRQFKMA